MTGQWSLPVDAQGLFGVYVHVPFCRHRCDYCAFATFTDRDHEMERYVKAVCREIEAYDSQPSATSIFVGGGTPTRLAADALAHLVASIPRRPGAEVTVECNPDDLTAHMCSVYATAGVNRVSIGVQSMRPHVLAQLGRTHDPGNVTRAVDAARSAGIVNINVDIIYGARGESVEDWEQTVRAAIDLGPTHVSAYGLTVEAGTPLAEDSSRHPDDDLQAEMYERADDLLAEAGFANYEVSNWSLPGRESLHNATYWLQGNYRGYGSAAHSHLDGHRWWNVRTPERYAELIEAGESARSASESLDTEERRLEGLQLLLRTNLGVPRDAFDPDDLVDLAETVTIEGDRVRLTRMGRLLANEVSMRLR